MLNTKDRQWVAAKAEITEQQVNAITELLADGSTVPFIARYRKEKTGGLDEVSILLVEEGLSYLKELNERKTTVVKTIEEQGKLTLELKQKIESIHVKQELEDLYLPFKPRRRTKGMIAREQGLAPLADAILSGSGSELADLAAEFVNVEKGVETAETALSGACYIVAELFSENADFRKRVRDFVYRKGVLESMAVKDWEGKRSKYEQYYEYREMASAIPSHRVLAIRRGEREKVLKTKLEVDRELIARLEGERMIPVSHPYREWLGVVLDDALVRLVLPSIELDIRGEMKKRADDEAISVFAANLEKLLLAAPAGNIPVLGVDPGYRTGCKIVALDGTGKLLAHDVIYPTKPREDTEGSRNKTLALMKKHGLKAVAIGNGTASRETEAFIRSIVDEGIVVIVVSESGASVYSASDVAREEFPDCDLTVRGAVSIGRRFQDPLSELVKIDPKAIGVGQYQHDVNQALLKRKLDTTVVSVVNRVGVDVNIASRHLLSYVSGIGETLATNIVAHRDENGPFQNRKGLKTVRMFGPKAFQQSAGFLRIRNGETPLDNTGIHPESYQLVTKMAMSAGIKSNELIQNDKILDKLPLEKLISDDFGLPTLRDIVKELKAPGRDPREKFEPFEFAAGIESLADLEEGMILNGIVTNVTDFGAFVDIGVHQDGLVHVSQLSNKFVKSPKDVVSVGDRIKARVVSVDTELKRISLSMKELENRSSGEKKKR
ncbi:MAG: RNA-binding transcriptional accessory protein [Acidobacteria bacterium CG_4_9_14_3_um_filter_49_7]|nr:MAG: RNA-binding transcriptional accessory protein [Acidobacteria bacterium CG_4_9_14_3_um_filter_49_7]